MRFSHRAAIAAGAPLRSALLLIACLFLSLTGCSRAIRKDPPPPPGPPVARAPEPIPPAAPSRKNTERPGRATVPPPQEPQVPLSEEPPPEIAGIAPKPPYEGVTAVFESREYRSAEGQKLPYHLYAPPNYDPNQRYPLVIFLHGASARGKRQLVGASLFGASIWASEETQRNHPAFVLVPHVNRTDSRWIRTWAADPGRRTNNKEPLELVIELIDSLSREFSIDSGRLYLTGLSMGGFGTWTAISRYPEMFAAAIPLCGGGDPSTVGATKAKVWAFHGDKDRSVPVRRSREMIAALRKAGAEPRYTEYPGVDHSVWKYAYQEPELVDWLFEQRRDLPGDLSQAHPQRQASAQ